MPEIFEIEEMESHDVATTVDHLTGLTLRHCEGPRGYLNWQAGHMISERRFMRVSRLSDHGEWQSVSLFRLLGHGWTRDEAIEMAQKNPNGRTA